MSSQHPTPRKLWQHADPKSTAMWKFMQKSNQGRGLNMQVSYIFRYCARVDLVLAMATLVSPVIRFEVGLVSPVQSPSLRL